MFSTSGKLRQVCLILTLLSSLSVPALAQVLTIDVGQTDQQLLGFGAQIWAGDTTGRNTITQLGMNFARLHHGVNFFSFPTQPPVDENFTANDNFTAMKQYISDNFNGPGGSEPWHLPSMQSSSTWADQNGVDLILNEFQIAYSFLNPAQTRMQDEHVDDFATFWAALLDYLNDNGVRPKYLELANEPNITLNGFISQSDYNTLVKTTRSVLDSYGFSDVGILGPGLNVLGEVSWVNSLDATGVNSLAGWSAHAWDDDVGIDGRAQIFENAVDNKDPNKPIFITEYATDKTTFNGSSYGDPDSGGNASNQAAFGVQSLSNTLSLINHGANALVLWEAADQSWSNLTWGLKRTNGTNRPTYFAMKSLLDHLPNDATVVEETWSDNDLTVAAFLADNQLIVALANTTDSTEARTLDLNDVPGVLLLHEAWQYDGVITGVNYTVVDGSVNISIPAESTQTIVFDILTPLPGDFNLDGDVDAEDLPLWSAGYGMSSGASFSDGDADNDGDVDGFDFLAWQQNQGGSLVTTSSISVVPEPQSFLIAFSLLLSGNAFLARRRV